MLVCPVLQRKISARMVPKNSGPFPLSPPWNKREVDERRGKGRHRNGTEPTDQSGSRTSRSTTDARRWIHWRGESLTDRISGNIKDGRSFGRLPRRQTKASCIKQQETGPNNSTNNVGVFPRLPLYIPLHSLQTRSVAATSRLSFSSSQYKITTSLN